MSVLGSDEPKFTNSTRGLGVVVQAVFDFCKTGSLVLTDDEPSGALRAKARVIVDAVGNAG